jgi:hypothetical protein
MRTKGSRRQATALGVVAAVLLGVLPAIGAPVQPPPKRVTWAPLFDQWSQYGLLLWGDLPGNHPEFPLGPADARYDREGVRAIIRSSLDVAHARGIRAIDVMFYFDPVMFEKAPTDQNITGLVDIGTDWVDQVERFNQTCLAPACEPFVLKLRLVATPDTLYYLRTSDPVTYHDLPECPPEDPPEPHDCARGYRAYTTAWNDPKGVPSRNSEVLDLGLPFLRSAVGQWADQILRRMEDLAPGTRVETMSLALDIGGESSLFSSKGITSFSNMTVGYAHPDRARFYRERQGHLRSTYEVFASAVRAHRSQGQPVKAGVFYQSWVLDDTIRGAFDLAELLRGTGVNVLHHTVWPRYNDNGVSHELTEQEHRMIVAASATVARKLGLEFDTEFSWAWYYPVGTFFGGGSWRWWPIPTPHPELTPVRVGDFTGDGLTDLLLSEAGSGDLWVARSNNSGFWVPEEWLPGAGLGTLAGIGDFNDDERADLIHLRLGETAAGDTLWVSLSTNENGVNQFAPPRMWGAQFGGRWGQYLVGDFNGDDNSDLLFVEPSDNTVHVNQADAAGTRFLGGQRWVGPNWFGHRNGRYLVGDFNGDGRDDLLFLEPADNSIHVSLTNEQGSAFFAPGSGAWKGANGFGGMTWGRHYVGNFDGQGGDDLLFFEPSNRTVHVTLSRKENYFFNSGVWLAPNHFGQSPDRWFPGDYTGLGGRADGLVDLGYLADTGEFYVTMTTTGESGMYNAHQRSDDNATSFLGQALAGFKFGAAGIVYAQWSTGDIRVPPATDAWRAIIGSVTPDDEHLNGPGGLLLPPATTPLDPARKAIYISTLGKVACEDAGTCPVRVYMRWFQDFGLTAELQKGRQVDILTDEMVRNGALGDYDVVYLPFETSFAFDETVCPALVEDRGRVRRQTAPEGPTAVLPLQPCP